MPLFYLVLFFSNLYFPSTQDTLPSDDLNTTVVDQLRPRGPSSVSTGSDSSTKSGGVSPHEEEVSLPEDEHDELSKQSYHKDNFNQPLSKHAKEFLLLSDEHDTLEKSMLSEKIIIINCRDQSFYEVEDSPSELAEIINEFSKKLGLQEGLTEPLKCEIQEQLLKHLEKIICTESLYENFFQDFFEFCLETILEVQEISIKNRNALTSYLFNLIESLHIGLNLATEVACNKKGLFAAKLIQFYYIYKSFNELVGKLYNDSAVEKTEFLNHFILKKVSLITENFKINASDLHLKYWVKEICMSNHSLPIDLDICEAALNQIKQDVFRIKMKPPRIIKINNQSIAHIEKNVLSLKKKLQELKSSKR